MNLPTQLFFLNSSRAGAGVGGSGGLVSLVLGFFALFFAQPYYNQLVGSATEAIGVSAFNPAVPLTMMAIAVAMFWGPVVTMVTGTDRERPLILTLLRTLAGMALMMMSIPLFVFALIHWWFYT